MSCPHCASVCTLRVFRHCVASRDLQCGDLVLEEQALSWAPGLDTRPVCLTCAAHVSWGGGWSSLLTTANEWRKYFEFHNARLGCCIGKYYGQTFDWKSFNWWKWKLILKSFKNFVLISNELLIKSMLKLSTLACWIVRNLTNIFDRNNLI